MQPSQRSVKLYLLKSLAMSERSQVAVTSSPSSFHPADHLRHRRHVLRGVLLLQPRGHELWLRLPPRPRLPLLPLHPHPRHPLRHRQEPRAHRLPAHLRRRPQRPRVLHLQILGDQPLRDGKGSLIDSIN